MADIPHTRCARCGLIEVCGQREDEPICAGCVWDMLKEEQDHNKKLREAAGALVKATETPVCCNVCPRMATQFVSLGIGMWGHACDEHAKDRMATDMPHAAPLRTLKALLEEGRHG